VSLSRALLACALGSLAVASARDARSSPPIDRLASGDSSSVLILPLSLLKTANLNFGQVASGPSAGTVVVTTAGARSATGGASLGSGALVSAAAFTVAGNPLATFSISLPASTTLTSGGNSTTVDTFTSSPSGSGQLSVLGTRALSVGATLRVGALLGQGIYAGTFNVTVAYN
jgi:uncharacterized protein DUF4402